MFRWEQVEEGLGQVMLVKEQGGAQGADGGLPKNCHQIISGRNGMVAKIMANGNNLRRPSP